VKLNRKDLAELTDLIKRHGPAEAARRIDRSPAAVRAWAKGTRQPSASALAALRAAFVRERARMTGPAPTALQNGHGAAGEPQPGSVSTSPALGTRSARELGRRQLDDLRAEIDRARASGASSRDVAGLERTFTAALRNFARLSGEFEISESAVARSPAFRAVRDRIVKTLAKHPTALRDVIEALEAAEQRSSHND
jgi:hypothetical protein